jgi:hypothetical protein
LYNAILRNGRRARNEKTPPAPGVLVEAPAHPVLIGNIFGDDGEPVRLPEGADSDSIAKYNFFLPAAKPPARNRATGAPR